MGPCGLRERGGTRVCHGYGKTRGVSKTRTAGTGTGMDFGTPRHTATRTRGITGIDGYIITRCACFFCYFKSFFSRFFFKMFIVSHRDATKYGACVAARTLQALTPTTPPIAIPSHIKKPGKLWLCTFKTNQWLIFRLIIQVLKVSKITIMVY